MPQPADQIDWPPVDTDAFVQMLCLFAEHLSADELRDGLLQRIAVHGRPLIEHFERLVLAERIADPQARANVVSAIGWTGRHESATSVRAALGDESPQVVRSAAVAAWFDLREPRLVPRLLELVGDHEVEPDVAVAAACSLARFRVHQALPDMVRLVTQRASNLDDEERGQVIEAVGLLTGTDFGPADTLTLRQRIKRLREWWNAWQSQADIEDLRS